MLIVAAPQRFGITAEIVLLISRIVGGSNLQHPLPRQSPGQQITHLGVHSRRFALSGRRGRIRPALIDKLFQFRRVSTCSAT